MLVFKLGLTNGNSKGVGKLLHQNFRDEDIIDLEKNKRFKT